MPRFKISPHLKRLAKKSSAIRKQFYPDKRERAFGGGNDDPLAEKSFLKIPGLIHKYPNRVLVLLTSNCAAYCRFCTRKYAVSDAKDSQLTLNDLLKIAAYIKRRKRVDEVIISGGDPLTVPSLLAKALEIFTRIKQLKIIRIGSRLPVSDPRKVDEKLCILLRKYAKKQALYLLLHFEHPDELSKNTVRAIHALRSSGLILLSQSVFLKGINDKSTTLQKLFTELLALGVKPYYLFHNDEPAGTAHFTVPFKREVKIMTELRKKMGGLTCPLYVYDPPYASAKIPVPLDFEELKALKVQ